jgi:bacteriorhodopsin
MSATRATLGGVALYQTIAAIRASTSKHGDDVAARANGIGAMVCLIAASVYHRMKTTSGAEVEDLRYADWLITCPLMLWEIYVLLGIDIARHAWSFALSVVAITVCIVLGRRAVESKQSKRALYFTLATAAFVIMLVNIGLFTDWSRPKHVAPLAFLGVWALYPLAFWEKSGAAYNLLDLVSKGVFGLYVGSQAF